MRRFIRHPTDMPIDYEAGGSWGYSRETLKNYSEGGLCFISDEWLEPDAEITIAIPVSQPVFQARCRVIWCKTVDDRFEVGVGFEDVETAYAMRMAEQICHIEQYKKDVKDKEGRELSGKEAAMEWIARYAAKFPE